MENLGFSPGFQRVGNLKTEQKVKHGDMKQNNRPEISRLFLQRKSNS